MRVLSHRGYWRTRAEQNGVVAFERSFGLGFGTETDVRDQDGNLVVAHDMPAGGEIALDDVLRMAADAAAPITLALNVKSCGLAPEIAAALAARPGLDAFVFDLAVPDMPTFFEAGIPVFTRLSDVEREPVWVDRAAGIWLDGFGSDWFDAAEAGRWLDAGKRVCIVSPELHGRAAEPVWERLRPLAGRDGAMICTDRPEAAQALFAGTP